MLQQRQNLKNLSKIDDTLMPFLENIKSVTELIKNAIINIIISDISNNTSNSLYYNLNNFFVNLIILE
jgi:hypothetical protein